MARRRLPVSEQLRRAIAASDLSRYAICKATGVDKGALSRFMAGKVGLTTDTIDKLCRELNLELTHRGEAKQ